MLPQQEGISAYVWGVLVQRAHESISAEPKLAGMLEDVVCTRNNLAESVAARLSRKLSRRDMSRDELEPLIRALLRDNPQVVDCIATDLHACFTRDAACTCMLEPLLFFKGFHALATYRVSHILWNQGRHLMALLFQSIGSEVFGVDIHPAARIGCGIMLDHGTGIVVGETSIIENCVSMLHAVTLGGTGKETGNRHPIVRSGVMLGAGAKILGRVEIGECAKVAASSVVLTDVAAHTTVAGVPAVVVGSTGEDAPAMCMQQGLI